LAGFTLHIDSHQGPSHWEGKNENDLNVLRQQYADMIAAVGGIYLVSIPPSILRLHEIPDVVRWGQANIRQGARLVLFTYRTATSDTSSGGMSPTGRSISPN